MLAYFDCFSGISGDMTLGAFIDLGVPVEWLQESIEKLPLTGFDISVKSISRKGIHATQAEVVTGQSKARDYAEIKSLITQSPLSGNVKNRSLDIFGRIAEAESGIHDCPKEKVHFHEVGGIDAIVDIVGTALCEEYLGIEKVMASRIPLGSGFVECRHGTLPVPAPATVAILKGVPVYGSGVSAELVTPTGAAIITSLAETFQAMPDMIVEKVGYGAGHRDLKSIPNLLRILVGTEAVRGDAPSTGALEDTVVIVETCIDDMNPEIFGFLMECLFQDGALDVYWMPVFMKKNRPGTMVQVLCHKNKREKIIQRILSETTSLGLRYYDATRSLLRRDHVEIDTPFGKIQVKRVYDRDGNVRIVPEYEVCKDIALQKKVPLKSVYETIIKSSSSQ
ncbi:nickel pincer cofactor biosynthesis protein LarC [Thermodesulfobacteriota bacterium]